MKRFVRLTGIFLIAAMLCGTLTGCKAFANKLDYTGSNEFATQYVNSVYKLYSGATAIVSGIESGSSDLWNSGLEELQEGIAQETELTKLALANLEKTATLLTKGDAIDDILKEWNPASQSE